MVDVQKLNQKGMLIEMKLNEFLRLITKDWITIGFDKANQKGQDFGHKTKEKIHKPTSTERLNKSHEKRKNPFRRKKRLSY